MGGLWLDIDSGALVSEQPVKGIVVHKDGDELTDAHKATIVERYGPLPDGEPVVEEDEGDKPAPAKKAAAKK